MAKPKNRGASQQNPAKVANPAYAQAMHELRSSSAAQRHTPRPQKGTRTQNKARAIREQHLEQG